MQGVWGMQLRIFVEQWEGGWFDARKVELRAVAEETLEEHHALLDDLFKFKIRQVDQRRKTLEQITDR